MPSTCTFTPVIEQECSFTLCVCSKGDAARLCRKLLVQRVLIEDTFRRDNEYASVASRVLVDEPIAAQLASRALRIELPFALSAKAPRSRNGEGASVSRGGAREALTLGLEESMPAPGDGPEQVIEIEDDAEDELDQVGGSCPALKPQCVWPSLRSRI